MTFNHFQTENPDQSRHPGQSGQIAVVILLVVVVMATLGLSELGQTTEDIFVSSQKEEATRVFNAAETGVEEALSDEGNFAATQQQLGDVVQQDGLEGNVTVTPETSFRSRVNQGETATVDVSASSGNVNIDFGAGQTCETASLMVALYNDTDPARYFFVKPHACAANANEFEAAANIAAGISDFRNRKSISLIPGDQLLRITPLYQSTELEVTGLNPNTTQSHTVRSTARLSDQPENTIEQIIEVDRSIPAAPSYMNYVLYSNGTIQHEP